MKIIAMLLCNIYDEMSSFTCASRKTFDKLILITPKLNIYPKQICKNLPLIINPSANIFSTCIKKIHMTRHIKTV